MKLTEKNFCSNIKDVSDNMRTAYYCKLTNKVCPKVSYSSGEPLPSKQFLEHSCSLLKEDEKVKIEIKEEKRVQKEEVKVVEKENQPKKTQKTSTGKKRTTKRRNCSNQKK